MLAVVTSILQYVGLVATVAMAVVSLFFEFAKDNPSSQRKQLTAAGKYALALIIVSGAASLVGTVAKDLIDNQKAEDAESEAKRQRQEIRLLSTTFENIEIKLLFDQTMNWKDARFLSTDENQAMCGTWVHYGVPNGNYADWCISKSRDTITSFGKKEMSVLYVEDRPEKIANFIDQNYPDLNNSLPSKIEFWTSEDSLKKYKPPNLFYFAKSYSDPVHMLRIEIPDPFAELKYVGESYDDFIFSVSMRMGIQQLIGTHLELDMRVKTPDVVDQGRAPAKLPYLAEHLAAVDLYLNGKSVKRVFDRTTQSLAFEATSVWALQNHEFTGKIFRLDINRDLIASFQDGVP